MISCKYLGMPYRAWIGEIDEALCEAGMNDIFSGGNFGSKDKERANQGIAISNRGKDGMKKPALLQAIHSANMVANTEFSVLRKVKILQPFGWILIGTRRLYRVATGKREMIHVKKLFNEAEKRKSIYRQFQLFEMDEK